MTEKKLILFDFDGTITDNSRGIINCIKYALGKMGKEIPSPDILRRFIGPSLFQIYYGYIDANEEDAQTFVTTYRERYAPIGTTEAELYPAIERVLCELKKDGYILCVCSNKPLPFVKKISASLGADKYFEGYYCPDFASHSSDKSGFIKEAMAHYSVSASQTLMIGDTHFDIEAGKGAGVESLGVTYGFGKYDEIASAGAEFITDSPEGIYKEITGRELRPYKAYIFGAGIYDNQLPDIKTGAFTIAADGGLEVCRKNGIKPSLIIGDFDSLGFTPEEEGVVKLPVEKDVTDIFAAADKAVAEGCEEIHIYGGMGGRPDHTLANIALLADLSKKGIKAYLYGEGYKLTALTDGKLILPGNNGNTLSVFSFTEKTTGVTLKGLKYKLENATLTNTYPLGVSNSFEDNYAEIEIEKGTVIIAWEV